MTPDEIEALRRVVTYYIEECEHGLSKVPREVLTLINKALASRAVPAAADVNARIVDKLSDILSGCESYYLDYVKRNFKADAPDIVDAFALSIREQAKREAYAECLACQPSTAENPNEDAYQRGRFDGVMEFARNIVAKKAFAEKKP